MERSFLLDPRISKYKKMQINVELASLRQVGLKEVWIQKQRLSETTGERNGSNPLKDQQEAGVKRQKGRIQRVRSEGKGVK